jgi:hypothetical protein
MTWSKPQSGDFRSRATLSPSVRAGEGVGRGIRSRFSSRSVLPRCCGAVAATPRAVRRDGGRPVEAAAIAVRAGAIDYPDMPSVIDRVLAARRAESIVNTARVLALVDRAIARELLLAIEPQAALIGTGVGTGVGTGGGMVGRAQWLQAWGLTDFDEAKRRYTDEFDDLARQPRLKLVGGGLLPMIELLVEPPSERARFILGSFDGKYWFPGDE